MFSLGFKWQTADADGKLRVLEYEVAGVLILVVVFAVGYLVRRKHKKTMQELKTLQALVPV